MEMQFTAKEDKECGKIMRLVLDTWSFRTCEISKKRCKRAVGVYMKTAAVIDGKIKKNVKTALGV